MNRKIVLSAFFATYVFAGSYDNGIKFYQQAKYKKAIESFKYASNKNDGRAMLAMGVIYANGDGVAKDENKSFEWFTKAADAKNENAWIKLGNIYATNKDYDNAFKYFEKAANAGNSKASYNLGYFYTGGLGADMNLSKSLYWYEKSAIAGNIDAQLNLGFMYIGGQGTTVDYKKAAYWIKKAKTTGDSKAQLMWDEFKLYDYEK